MSKRSGNSPAPGVAAARPWITVALAALLLFVANANNNSFGVFFKPIAEQFGWSRGAVSIAVALRWVAAAGLVMPLGHFSDRYGPRRVILPSLILVGIGFLLTSRVTAEWHLYLVQGLIMGAGVAGPYVCIVSTVARWHDKRRGLALGLASVGTGLAVVFFPPLTASLIEGMGWEQASMALGLVVLTAGIPASVFMKDPPAIGKPSPGVASAGTDGDGQVRKRGPFDVMRSLPGLLRDRQFLSVFLVFTFFYEGANLVTNHLVNYVTDAGISTLVAASMMSVVGVAGIAGRLAMGPVSDRIGTRADAAMCCSLVIAALVLFTLKVEPLMWVSAVLFGAGSGAAAPLVSAMVGDYFGTKRIATITGAILIGSQLGSAAGPWIGGFLFDVTDSYLWSLILSAVLVATGLAIALRLGPPTGKSD